MGEGAPRARECHVNAKRIGLIIPAKVIDEPQVNDIDPQLWIHDLFQRFEHLVVTVRLKRYNSHHDHLLRPCGRTPAHTAPNPTPPATDPAFGRSRSYPSSPSRSASSEPPCSATLPATKTCTKSGLM